MFDVATKLAILDGKYFVFPRGQELHLNFKRRGTCPLWLRFSTSGNERYSCGTVHKYCKP